MAAITTAAFPLDRALVYYLPFSNNLSSCAAPILSALAQGLEPLAGATSRVGVLAQV